jgi:hypothetical protein
MTKTESDILIINEAQRPRNLESSKEEVRAELERALGSRTFRFAEGQKTFLKYTVEEVLAGRGHLIRFVRRNRGSIPAQVTCQVSDRAQVRGSGRCGNRRIFS